jgi:predicted RecB family nuclease
MKITNTILKDYLACDTKGHLELAGETGTKSDYEAMTEAIGQASRKGALAKLVARFGEGDACRGLSVTVESLKQGKPLLVDAVLEDEVLSLRFDALKRTDGASKLGDHYYLPVLHNHTDKNGHRQKLLLAVFGLVLARVQGLRPATGLVARGPEGLLGKAQLGAKVYRQAEQVLAEVKRLQAGGEPPKLALNDHCQMCEFRQRCHKQAEEADDISLLGGVGEKELKRYHRKGIFTLTQLSCTFRARKRSKRVKRQGHIRYAALQALAIREKKIYVYGTPALSGKPVQLFFDAEGVEEATFVYLLGVLVVEGDVQTMHSFWADSPDEEVQIFDSFLDLLARYEDFALFHFGSYERALLRRMRQVVTRKGLIDRALDKAVNVLSFLHACVYFPTFSNGLKDVGRYLGCNWTDEKSCGLQSLVWRASWVQAKDSTWKDKLVTYNAEDCAALKKVTECVQAIGEAARNRGAEVTSTPSSPVVAWADEVGRSFSHREFCEAKFTIEDFDRANSCAYFDYQREKVFLRTSKAVKRACLNQRRRVPRPKATRVVEIKDDACPKCGGKQIIQLREKPHSKLAYDLKLTRGGIHRQVIRCRSTLHWCEDCKRGFSPEGLRKLDGHLHGLKSWAMYQHIVHRVNFSHLQTMFRDCFGLRVDRQHLHGIRALMANRYRKCHWALQNRPLLGASKPASPG